MVFSLARTTGWFLMAVGVLFFIQTVQLALGATSSFGIGFLGFLFRGGISALAESVVLTALPLGIGWWLLNNT